MGPRRQGDLVRNKLPSPGDIPGAGLAREQDKIRDYL